LDMNGIIHQATHGTGTEISKPLTEEEMMVRITRTVLFYFYYYLLLSRFSFLR
jgi:5'-3' exonuclease